MPASVAAATAHPMVTLRLRLRLSTVALIVLLLMSLSQLALQLISKRGVFIKLIGSFYFTYNGGSRVSRFSLHSPLGYETGWILDNIFFYKVFGLFSRILKFANSLLADL